MENSIVLVKEICKPRVSLMEGELSVFTSSCLSVKSNSPLRLLQGPPRKGVKKVGERSHETFRLLRRKNLIVEAVRSFKVIEGLFPSVKVIR